MLYRLHLVKTAEIAYNGPMIKVPGVREHIRNVYVTAKDMTLEDFKTNYLKTHPELRDVFVEKIPYLQFRWFVNQEARRRFGRHIGNPVRVEETDLHEHYDHAEYEEAVGDVILEIEKRNARKSIATESMVLRSSGPSYTHWSPGR